MTIQYGASCTPLEVVNFYFSRSTFNPKVEQNSYPRFGISCLGKVSTVYENDRDLAIIPIHENNVIVVDLQDPQNQVTHQSLLTVGKNKYIDEASQAKKTELQEEVDLMEPSCNEKP
ncbi:hypothetical protein Fmac_014970 [Flemingia macrophylla]|uniref:Uncharacterized protein n=1 Tax=Flemingia macrophylla TaxID=520843 RepID=A0ABD1MDC4_9FABA